MPWARAAHLYCRFLVTLALHPIRVAKSSTSFGTGKGGNVTSLCDPVWPVSSRRHDACCILLCASTIHSAAVSYFIILLTNPVRSFFLSENLPERFLLNFQGLVELWLWMISLRLVFWGLCSSARVSLDAGS